MNSIFYSEPIIVLNKIKKSYEKELDNMLDKGILLEKIEMKFKSKMFFYKIEDIITYIKENRPDKMYLITANDLNLL